MEHGFELLQARERLRVGRRFLTLRPKLTTFGALGNAAFLASSQAPAFQKAALAAAFGSTIAAFYVEAWWLKRRELSERWLFSSLSATLCVLGLGALLSGGLTSPVLPLLFAPVVVGSRRSAGQARARRFWPAQRWYSCCWRCSRHGRLCRCYLRCPLPRFAACCSSAA
jgi:hypothetical protein